MNKIHATSQFDRTALHRNMSTGVSYGEQLVYDIERLKRHFPAVPVKVILVDVDESDQD